MANTRTARRLAALDVDLSTFAEDRAASMARHALGLAVKRANDDDSATDCAQVAALLAMAEVAATEDRSGDVSAVRRWTFATLADMRADRADDSATLAGDSTDLAEVADSAESLWSPRAIAPDTITRTTTTDVRADALAMLDDSDLDTLAVARRAIDCEGYDSASGLPSAARLAATMGLARGRASARLAASLATAVGNAQEAREATLNRHRSAFGLTMAQRTATHPSALTNGAAPSHRSATPSVDIRELDAIGKRNHGGSARPVTTAATASPVVVTRPNGVRYVMLSDRALILDDDSAAIVLADLTAATPYGATDSDRAADDWAMATTPSGPVVKSSPRRKRNGGSVGTSVVMTRSRRRWADTSAAQARMA